VCWAGALIFLILLDIGAATILALVFLLAAVIVFVIVVVGTMVSIFVDVLGKLVRIARRQPLLVVLVLVVLICSRAELDWPLPLTARSQGARCHLVRDVVRADATSTR
jgi:hypothetical protein